MLFNVSLFNRWPYISRLLMVIFIIFWTLVIAEMYLRVFKPQAMLPRYVVATDFGIRGNMPQKNYWHSTPDYRIHIRTNSRGIRADEEIKYDKPEGVKRIVVLGDSFGMGYGVNLQDTLLTIMSNRLRDRGVQNQIVNLSVSGYGTAEELIMLKEEGIKYQPDIILLMWHTTDLDENIRSRLYKLEDSKLVRDSLDYLPGVKIREILFKYSLYRWIAENSHLYTWLRERLAVAIKKWLTSKRDSDIKEQRSISKPKSEKIVQPDYKSRLYASLLDEVDKVSKANGAELIILDIPLKVARSNYKSTFPIEALHNPRDLTVVSPIVKFNEYLNKHTNQLLYWERSHGHFTPEGCQIVGELLADKIMNMNWLSN